MCVFNVLFFHTVSIITWVRELKVPSPKAGLTLPHLHWSAWDNQNPKQTLFHYRAPPPLQLYQKTRMKHAHKAWSMVSFFLPNTHQELPVSKKSVIYSKHSNFLQKKLTAAGLPPILTQRNTFKLYFRVRKCAQTLEELSYSPDITFSCPFHQTQTDTFLLT